MPTFRMNAESESPRMSSGDCVRTASVHTHASSRRGKVVPQRAGRVTRRAGAEDGAAVDAPGLRRLSGVLILVLGWVLLSVRLPVPPLYCVSLLFSVLYL